MPTGDPQYFESLKNPHFVTLEPGMKFYPDDDYWRRLYAGMAMQGLIRFDLDEARTAMHAVRYADELLAELKPKETADAAQ